MKMESLRIHYGPATCGWDGLTRGGVCIVRGVIAFGAPISRGRYRQCGSHTNHRVAQIALVGVGDIMTLFRGYFVFFSFLFGYRD